MLASVRTFALLGIEAREVLVEADVARGGLPSFSLVGLPDPAVRESRERVRSALVNSGFKFPMSRITANLAPADLRKAGPSFDLAIAAALLAASGQLSAERLSRVALAGELALDGSIRPVPGVLAMAEAARELDVGGDRGPGAERAGGSPCRRAEGRAAGPDRAARASGHRGRAADSLAADLERERLRARRRRTSRTCADSRTFCTPSRWRPPEVTAC